MAKQQWTPNDSRSRAFVEKTFLYNLAVPPLDDLAVVIWGITWAADFISRPMQRLQHALDNKDAEAIWKQIEINVKAEREAKKTFYEEKAQKSSRAASEPTRSAKNVRDQQAGFADARDMMDKRDVVQSLAKTSIKTAFLESADSAFQGHALNESQLREALAIRYQEAASLMGGELIKELFLGVRPQDLSVPAMQDIVSIMSHGINKDQMGITIDKTYTVRPIGAAAIGAIRAVIVEDRGLSFKWADNVPLHDLEEESKELIHLAFRSASRVNVEKGREVAANLVAQGQSRGPEVQPAFELGSA